MEALIIAIILTYAIKKAAENGHLHWQSSKSANRKSTRGRSVPKRAASAVQHDVGYWAHQILNGFPQARRGLANGWHAGRTAQAQGIAERHKARTENLEQRAGLIEQVREHRRRQDEALERIRAAQDPEPQTCIHGVPPPCGICDAQETPAPEPEEQGSTACDLCGLPLAAGDQGIAHPECIDAREQQETASTANTKGTTAMASDVTYDGTISRMASAINAAEDRGQEAAAAKNWANQTADEMQSLNLDPVTLGAMADHLDALDAAEKAQQRVIETAQSVDAALKQGHAGLAEAHQNAPVPAADRQFYDD